ncbi:MAG: ATP-binding protein [bacterium]
MNLNKLLKQFKIRNKLTIAFTLLATVPLLLTGFWGVKYTIRILEDISLQDLQSDISNMQIKVDRFLNEIKSDIYYLRDSYVFREMINALENEDKDEIKKWQHVVEEQFRDFASNRKVYYQLRFLDQFTNEMLKIEHDGIITVVTPQDELTRRQDVFYLYSVENNQNSELQFTPVELTNEKFVDRIIPAISYFLPVYSLKNREELQGILIANVYAQTLFDILAEAPVSAGRRTILADSEGFYIYNSDKTEWNKLLALRKEGNIERDFPAAAHEQILSGKPGLIEEQTNKIVAYTPIYFTGSKDNFLVLLRCISKDLIHQPSRSFMKLVLLFGSASFAIALVLGFVAANQFTRPIKDLSKSSEMLAKGHLDYRIHLDTNDEIEQLAVDFNHMADVIKHHQEQLKEYAEILEQKVAERTRELSKTLNYLQKLIDSSVDAIITLDTERNITLFSRGAQKIFGYQVSEVIGKQICTLCKSCVEKRCPLIEVADTDKKLHSYQIDFVKKNGQTLPINISASPIKNENEEVTGILTIGKDMTEQIKMGKQIQQAEKLAGIGQLAAGIAHQLNTPLASIILSAQMTKEVVDDKEILDDLDRIERQADHCEKIIKELLSFSRPADTSKSAVKLEDIIRLIIDLMHKKFKNSHITVSTEFDERGSAIYGNANQIEQLFFNLLNNAQDAMTDGGEIKISTSRNLNKVQVKVSDTGMGIPKENLNKIFDPFYTNKDVGKGTGLGLSVCYGIVKEHKGRIEVESESGKGTTFTITLPFYNSRKTA